MTMLGCYGDLCSQLPNVQTTIGGWPCGLTGPVFRVVLFPGTRVPEYPDTRVRGSPVPGHPEHPVTLKPLGQCRVRNSYCGLSPTLPQENIDSNVFV
eukprot:3440490-Rhodomonas_salina.1